jgi:hypothetical protein
MPAGVRAPTPAPAQGRRNGRGAGPTAPPGTRAILFATASSGESAPAAALRWEDGTLLSRLVAQFAELEKQVAARIGEVQAKVENERQKINGYNMQLGALDAEAHDLVGQVAKRNFLFVRDKLRGIVLRADVGITEQAWEVREEELERVHNLQTERAREEQLLDEELREVLDDSGEAPASPANPAPQGGK